MLKPEICVNEHRDVTNLILLYLVMFVGMFLDNGRSTLTQIRGNSKFLGTIT